MQFMAVLLLGDSLCDGNNWMQMCLFHVTGDLRKHLVPLIPMIASCDSTGSKPQELAMVLNLGKIDEILGM